MPSQANREVTEMHEEWQRDQYGERRYAGPEIELEAAFASARGDAEG
jgi:hypothetical protein